MRVDREKREPRRRGRGMETDSGRVCLDRAGKCSRHVVHFGRSSVPSGLGHCGRHQQDGRGHDQVREDDWGKCVRHHQERHPHEGADKRSRAAEARVSQQYTPQHVREDAGRSDVGFDGRTGGARARGRRSDGDWSRRQERQELHRQERKRQKRPEGSEKRPRPADRKCFYCHRKGHIKEECRIRMADERESKNKDEKDKRKDKRLKQKEKKRVNAMQCRGQGNQGTSSSSSTSLGEVQATVGALQGRMIFAVRATHGSTINSSKVAGCGNPTERMRLAPLRTALMLDSGAQVSAVPRQQIYNPGPSNVTGLKGINGEDIPRYGHLELNLGRGQDVVQVGAEVAGIEHGIIATDAIVKRGRSPAGYWIVDGTLGPPSQTTAIKLRTHQANCFLEFDEILRQDETDQGASVAAVRRGDLAKDDGI